MATFEPILYTYVPTAPRSKTRTVLSQTTPKPFSIFDENLPIEASGVRLDGVQPSVVVVAERRGDRPGVQEKTSTIYSGGNAKANDHDYNDEVAVGRRSGSADHHMSASYDGSGKSQDNPIILGDNKPSDCETEVDQFSLRRESTELDAGLCSSSDTGSSSRTLAPPSSSEGHLDIESNRFTDVACRLPVSEHLLSDPLHDRTSTESSHISHARSEGTPPSSKHPSSPSPHTSIAVQELYSHISQRTSDKAELVRYISDTFGENQEEPKRPPQEREMEITENSILSSAQDRSPSSLPSSASPQTPFDQQDQSRIIRSGSIELQCISPLDTLGNSEHNQEKEEGDGRGEVLPKEERGAPLAKAKSSGDTDESNKEDGKPQAAKRQRLSLYYNPSQQTGQDERGNDTDSYNNDEQDNTRSEDSDDYRPAKRQRPFLSCNGSTPPKSEHQEGRIDSVRRRHKGRRRSYTPHSSSNNNLRGVAHSLCRQSGKSGASLPEHQNRETITRHNSDQSTGTSLDGRPANTAKSTPAVPESTRLTEPSQAAQAVDTNRDWDIRDIIGKEIVGGEVYYLVDWRPTLLAKHELRSAKEVVDEFEARLRVKFDSKNGRGGPSLKQGKPVIAVADAPGKTPQKRPRGRPRKQS